MNHSELCYTPASELTSMIVQKEISPVELMEAVIQRVNEINPRLNAICTFTPEKALDEAKKAEAAVQEGIPLGPLHGIPLTIKDLSFTKGIRTMAGSRMFENRIPDFDWLVVTRLQQAGGISLGKTTTSEFGWKGCSESPLTGISHNPWKEGMNAGGSSAGAAICAAAGMGPLHQGSDGAGSIRVPADFCGVYGIKPSYGRVPFFPMINSDTGVLGPITRTVADAALMLEVMAGPDDRDMTSLSEKPEYLARLNEGIDGLRVAWSSDLGYLPVDQEVAEPVARAVKVFEDLGCLVEEVDPGWGDPREMALFFWAANFAGNLGSKLEKWEDQMGPGLVACIRDGQHYRAAEYVQMKQRRVDFYSRVQPFFDNFDLLLTPTLSVAAFPAERIVPEHWEQHPWDWLSWAGFSYPFNLTWMPAATCPCGFTPDGLPIGLQIVAGRFQDLRVLQASKAFEEACPWAQHRPIP